MEVCNFNFLKSLEFYLKLDKFCESNSLYYYIFNNFYFGCETKTEYFRIFYEDEEYITHYDFSLYSKHSYTKKSGECSLKHFLKIVIPREDYDENLFKKVSNSNFVDSFVLETKGNTYYLTLELNVFLKYENLIELFNDYFIFINKEKFLKFEN